MSIEGLQEIVGRKITGVIFHSNKKMELLERVILGFEDGTHFEIFSGIGGLGATKTVHSDPLEEIEANMVQAGEDIRVFR